MPERLPSGERRVSRVRVARGCSAAAARHQEDMDALGGAAAMSGAACSDTIGPERRTRGHEICSPSTSRPGGHCAGSRDIAHRF